MNFGSCIGLLLLALALPAQAQLAITEVFSSSSTNGTPALHADWWELTNFGSSPMDVSGYRFNDSNGDLTNGAVVIESLVLAAGESVIFLEQSSSTGLPSADDFRTWWGGALPVGLRIIPYATNNIGLSSAGDAVRLWDATTTNEDDLVAVARFDVATTGSSFTYDPVTGGFGGVTQTGSAGAISAADNGDIASPGMTTGPVPLAITAQPTNTVVNPLATATFTISAIGLPQPRIRWRFKGVEIADATTATLTIVGADESKVGAYQAVLNNGLTTVESDLVQLSLTAQPTPPSFTQKPADATNFIGGSATFAAAATGVPPPTYQWFFGTTELAGQTNNVLVLTNLQVENTGEYRIEVNNPSGTTNAEARLTVRTKPDLRITEVESSEALDADFVTVYGFSKQDWWEVTSFESVPVALQGWRFDDSSANLANAYTITNDVVIMPGESVVFVEVLTAEQFRTWWGSNNVPAAVKIVSYSGSGLGMSSGGDGVRLWYSTTTSNSDTVAAVDFGPADAGISFNYDPDSGVFGAKSVVGVFGVFVAEAMASGGQDIGSPGRIREGELPPVAPIITIVADAGQFFIDFLGEAGRTYRLQQLETIDGAEWQTLGLPQMPTEDGPLRFGRPDLPALHQLYFRVLVE